MQKIRNEKFKFLTIKKFRTIPEYTFYVIYLLSDRFREMEFYVHDSLLGEKVYNDFLEHKINGLDDCIVMYELNLNSDILDIKLLDIKFDKEK